MISELHIKNFAIIDQLDLSFIPGLITFTGETGAGKSIIIDAVEIVLGGRADATMVRTGCDHTTIEAVFLIPPVSFKEVHALLEREALLDDQEYLSLSREIRPNGRNIARINGRNVSAGLLREIGDFLIDIHGQSEHLSLLRVNHHMQLLDRYALTDSQSPISEAKASYSLAYQRLHDIRHDLEQLRQAELDAARRMDVLNYQIKEIEAARLQIVEEAELREERNRLANAESIASLTQQALAALDEGAPDSPATTDLFGQVTQLLSSLSRVDPTQIALYEQANVLFENLSDLATSLRDYLENIEFNPKRLDQVEERLALIQNLKRKYGDSIQAVLDFAENAKDQLDQITHSAERIQELEAEEIELLTEISRSGLALSEARHKAASAMERGIEAELNGLRMSGARFKVEFQQHNDLNGVTLPDGRKISFYPTGLERVEFLIESNPGEGFKPLIKIASGGETSRLMLALKYVLAQADQIPTLIFDEIDQGIGGRVGGIVGNKLWGLGRQHQVICVTHLPQLAAYGDLHFHVEKSLSDGRTTTKVKQLLGQDRIQELAQMLGSVSESTLQSARELIQDVKKQTAP